MGDFEDAAEPEFTAGPVRRATRSSGWRIVGIVFAVGALTLVICCGAGAWFFGNMMTKELPAAQVAADAFLDDLKAGDIDGAYAQTATALQNGTSKDQFRGLFEFAPAPKGHTSRTLQLVRLYKGTGGGSAQFRVTFQGPNGSGGGTLTLIKENGEWKVGGLYLDPPAAKPAGQGQAQKSS